MHNKILKVLIFIVLLFSTNKKVLASELIEEKEEGVYYVRRGGEEKYFSAPFMNYYIDGLTTYCIEPGTRITSQEYIKEDGLVNSPYSKELNDKLELIGYYGYDYPTHKTIKYKMATQALIWETINPDFIVDFWTEQYGYGDAINVDKEKKEIMKLVDSHYEKPGLPEVLGIVLPNEMNITDKKGILNQFEVIDDGGLEVKINGNDLHLSNFKPGTYTVTLAKKRYTNNVSNLFVGKDSDTQIMAYFGLTTPFVWNLTVIVSGADISVKKLDADTLSTSSKGDASLIGTTFYIFNLKDELIDTLTVGDDFKAVGKKIRIGNYYLVEAKAGKGYNLDTKRYYFSVEDETPIELVIYNKVIEKELQIIKLKEGYDSKEFAKEENITFEVYLKSNMQKVGTIKTNEDGCGSIILPYGVYIVKQINTTPGYELANDFEVVVSENSEEIIKKTIINKIKNYKIKVKKIDSKTKKLINLDGIKFKIKNLTTNEYVCDNKDCTYETKKGYLESKYLQIGKYALEEVENQIIKGYTWNKNSLIFEINDDDNIYKKNNNEFILELIFENTPIKGKINIKKYGEKVTYKNNNYLYDYKLLDNIEFSLYAYDDIYYNNELIYKKNTLIGKYLTKNGNITIDNLYLGNYYLKETKTLNNYSPNNTIYNINLTNNNQYEEIVQKNIEIYNNLIKGKIKFIKLDKEGKTPLKNVVIEIYDIDNNTLVFSGKTDDFGQIELNNLYKGKFYLIEKETLEGYILNNEKINFEIKENNEVINIEMLNEKIKGNVIITKKDKNNQLLKDTQINIIDKDGNIIYEGKTNESGQIIINNLEYGKYFIKEIKASEGYILNDEPIEFEITNNNETINIEMINEKITGKLLFLKKDKTTNEPLSDILIQIYNENKVLIYEGYTDINGNITINNLPYGNYYIIEKETKDGYILYTGSINFQIKNNNEVIEVVMYNEKIPEVKEDFVIPKTYANNNIFYIIFGFLNILIGLKLKYGIKK